MNKILELYETQGHKKTRLVLNQDLKQYEEAFLKLLDKKESEAIRFARYFYHLPEVKEKIDVFFKTTKDFPLKVQCIYEIFDSKVNIDDIVKPNYKEFLLENIDDYKKICEVAYFNNLKQTNDGYFIELKKKINETKAQKKWLYLFELAVLYNDKEEAKIIMENYITNENDFIRGGAEILITRF